jgi:hypothetical protein
MRDSWMDLEDGYVVAREERPGVWLVSWYPYGEDHPDFPGHSISSRDADMPADGGLEAILQWAWQRYAREPAGQKAA